MLYLGKKEYDSIVKHVFDGLPNEACGLLGGVIEQGVKVIKEVYMLRNMDQSKEHFSMDSKEQLNAVKDLRKKGYILFGNFHSHPDTPARPSEEDKRLAYDPAANYLIMSIQDRTQPILKAFQISGGTVIEERIELIP